MPLLLNTATAVISVTTTTTQVLHVHVDMVDLPNGGTTISPVNGQNSIINSATVTNIGPSPAASTSRAVKTVAIKNTDVAAVTIVVKHNDGSATVSLETLTLQPGWSYRYEEKRGWYVTDASGIEVTDNTSGAGRFLKRTYILNGTTTFTTQPTTTSIVARLLAGGGQGGGSPATTGENGSGGGSGSYAEFVGAVSPSTAYTCAVGAGGSTATAGQTGQTGGNTTLTIGATTITCNGGVGGAPGTSIAIPVLGGAGGAISTNGTLNIPGNPGEPNVTIGTAADNRSGFGASSPLGNGGAPLLNASNTNGNAAGGFGAGGGGASTTGTSHAGGAGSNGIIVVDEYT